MRAFIGIVYLVLVTSNAHATDTREVEALIRSIRARWYDATEPRHLNKILNLQITRVLDMFMPDTPEFEQLSVRMKLSRFAGDVDEFHRRRGVGEDYEQRIDALAEYTARLLIAASASDLNEDAFAAQNEVTLALVPLIEAHLLIGVEAGTRPKGSIPAIVRHWMNAAGEAEGARTRFWAALRKQMQDLPAWIRLSEDEPTPASSEIIARRVVRLVAEIVDPAVACRRALHHD